MVAVIFLQRGTVREGFQQQKISKLSTCVDRGRGWLGGHYKWKRDAKGGGGVTESG